MGTGELVQRVLRPMFMHERRHWISCMHRDAGIRHELVPQWCKELWGDPDEGGLDRVPHRKFHAQRQNHHAESYAMAVMDGRATPDRWESLDGTKTNAPAWIAAPQETLYECFRLLNAGAAPARTHISHYGEAVLDAAVVLPNNAAFCEGIRAVGDGIDGRLVDPDVIALPSSGGVPAFVEVKGAGDTLKPDQVRSLRILSALGFRVEVWWILPQGMKARQLAAAPQPDGHLTSMGANVREGLDWPAIRARAQASIPLSQRARGCRCEPKGSCLAVGDPS